MEPALLSSLWLPRGKNISLEGGHRSNSVSAHRMSKHRAMRRRQPWRETRQFGVINKVIDGSALFAITRSASNNLEKSVSYGCQVAVTVPFT